MTVTNKYEMISKMRKIAEANGWKPHPRSGFNNNASMGKLIDAVAKKLEVAGHSESEVEAAILTNTKHLCAAWRGLEENSNFCVEKYLASPHAQGEVPDWAANGDGSSEGPSDEGGSNDGDGQNDESTSSSSTSSSNGDGEGSEGESSDGQSEENSDGEDSQGEGPCDTPDSQDSDESEDSDTPEEQQGQQQEQQQSSEDAPDDPDYEPPSIWYKCVRIIKWNLAHPGEAKNIMLVGPKGIGKTKMVFELSKKFFKKRPYATTAPQMEFKICGFNNALGEEVKTPITKGYVDDGAIILIDEIDRMDASAGIALNMATANKVMDTPNGSIEQNPNVTFIATANTSGTGATNDYNTANQLDASTRDRWIYLLMEWDHNVAVKVARDDMALVKGLEDWNKACDKIQYTSGQLSYRTIIDILDLMDMGCFTFEECIQSAMLKYAIPKSNLVAIYEQMEDHYNKVAKAIKKIMDAMPDNDSIF